MRIDALLGGSVEAGAATAPPGSPIVGRLYPVAAAATGAWSGHDGQLAAYTAGGWRFVTPFEGLRLTERISGVEWVRTGSTWEVGQCRASAILIAGQQVVGARQATIAAPAGGAVSDTEARACIGAILNALKTHGLIAP